MQRNLLHINDPDTDFRKDATGTEAEVIRDIVRRQEMGKKKYGTEVAENPLPLEAWLQHAYEETLDKAIYLKRAIKEMKANKMQTIPHVEGAVPVVLYLANQVDADELVQLFKSEHPSARAIRYK